MSTHCQPGGRLCTDTVSIITRGDHGTVHPIGSVQVICVHVPAKRLQAVVLAEHSGRCKLSNKNTLQLYVCMAWDRAFICCRQGLPLNSRPGVPSSSVAERSAATHVSIAACLGPELTSGEIMRYSRICCTCRGKSCCLCAALGLHILRPAFVRKQLISTAAHAKKNDARHKLGINICVGTLSAHVGTRA